MSAARSNLPPDIQALVSMLHTTLSLYSKGAGTDWTVHEAGSANRFAELVIVADQTWRRRPTQKKGEGWKEMADICKVSGGMSEPARVHAQMLALSRKLVPQLCRSLLETLAQLHGAEVWTVPSPAASAAPAPVASPSDAPSAPDPSASPERPPLSEGRMARIMEGWHDVLDRFAELRDRFFALCGGEDVGFPISDRNAPPHRRLVSGGDVPRHALAALLRDMGDLIDPRADAARARVRGIPRSERTAEAMLPSAADFFTALPYSFQTLLDGRSHPPEVADSEEDDTPRPPLTPDEEARVNEEIAILNERFRERLRRDKPHKLKP